MAPPGAWRQREGKEPTLSELGQKVGVAPERLAPMLAAQRQMRGMIADPERAALAPDSREDIESRVLMRDALRSLGKPYAQVLWLRFYAGYSQTDIARRYGVSQAQISRWEREGRERLKSCW